MKFIETSLKGAYVIDVEYLKDERGGFSRLFCKNEFEKINHKGDIVQINHSVNKYKGTIRGFHYQSSPKSEIKIIKCIKGEVYDVIIDLRKNSPTFLKCHGEILSEDNQKMMYVPKGFAHGFQTMKDNTELIYFHTEFYDKDKEQGICYNDDLIKVSWPLKITNISEKDKNRSLLDKTFRGI